MTLLRPENYGERRLCVGPTQMAKCASNPRLKSFKLLSRDCLLGTLSKTNVRVNSLLFVGCQILQKSKVNLVLLGLDLRSPSQRKGRDDRGVVYIG